MDSGTNAIELFMQCGRPFSVLSGGHSNAGASVVMGRRLLTLRFMDHVNAKFDEGALYKNNVWDGFQDVGTVSIGAGATSGSAIFAHVSFVGSDVFLALSNLLLISLSNANYY